MDGSQSENSQPDSGAAYVFVRNGTNWSQQAYLKASNTGTGDRFGQSASVSGETVVVGAIFEASNATGVNGNQSDNSALQAGAAYVFVRSGTNWSQQAFVKASNTGAFDSFGNSVAVSGDTVAVGASLEDSSAIGVDGNQNDNSTGSSGAAYLFTFLSRVALVPDGSGGYFLRFDGIPDRTYRLQRAPSVTGPWDTIDTQTAPLSGLIEYQEVNPPQVEAFYRAVQP